MLRKNLLLPSREGKKHIKVQSPYSGLQVLHLCGPWSLCYFYAHKTPSTGKIDSKLQNRSFMPKNSLHSYQNNRTDQQKWLKLWKIKFNYWNICIRFYKQNHRGQLSGSQCTNLFMVGWKSPQHEILQKLYQHINIQRFTHRIFFPRPTVYKYSCHNQNSRWPFMFNILQKNNPSRFLSV